MKCSSSVFICTLIYCLQLCILIKTTMSSTVAHAIYMNIARTANNMITTITSMTINMTTTATITFASTSATPLLLLLLLRLYFY